MSTAVPEPGPHYSATTHAAAGPDTDVVAIAPDPEVAAGIITETPL